MHARENFYSQEPRNGPAGRNGFSLIETIVWIAVFTFAMLALSEALLTFYKTNRIALQQATAVASGEQGIDTAVKAIRIADYSSNGGYPVISIAPDQIAFYANVTPNDEQVQQVRLFVSGTQFEEGIIEPSGDPPTYSNPETDTILTNYVQNLALATSTFTYYDQNGNEITDDPQFQDVRFVVIDLIVNVSTTSTSTALTLESSAAMRNLAGN